jgi:hypothetical protein
MTCALPGAERTVGATTLIQRYWWWGHAGVFVMSHPRPDDQHTPICKIEGVLLVHPLASNIAGQNAAALLMCDQIAAWRMTICRRFHGGGRAGQARRQIAGMGQQAGTNGGDSRGLGH